MNQLENDELHCSQQPSMPSINDSIDDNLASKDQNSMTAEEEFLASILSSQDKASLHDPQQDARIQKQAYDYLTQEQREHIDEIEALELLFDDIRNRSHEGELTTPDYWIALNLAPQHLTTAAFTNLIFDTLIQFQDNTNEERKPQDTSKEAQTEHASVCDTDATSDVCEIKTDTTDDTQDTTPTNDDASIDGDSNTDLDQINFDSLDPEVKAAYNELVTKEISDISDIQVLEGSETYLYSQRGMTDNFAHWAFLAAEDDDVITLVDNTRTESKIYPRPMIIDSLYNKPFYMTYERVMNAYKTAQESGQYPDILTCCASNDDLYFYSTLYLSTPQAKALAEWYSVERKANM